MQTVTKFALGAVVLSAAFLAVSEWNKNSVPTTAPLADEAVSQPPSGRNDKDISRRIAQTRVPPESWRGNPRAITQTDQDNAVLWWCLATQDGAAPQGENKKLRICVDTMLGGNDDQLNRRVMDMVCDGLYYTPDKDPAKNADYKEKRADCYASRAWSNISTRLRADIDENVRTVWTPIAHAERSFENANAMAARIRASQTGTVKDPREQALKNRLP